MKCFDFFALTLVLTSLFGLSLSNAISSDDSVDSATNKIQFSNLNIDVKFLILEQLDLIDLISMAEISEDLSALAANVFSRKFLKEFVKIHNPLYYFPYDVHYQLIDDTLLIQQFETILKLLKHFGHRIPKLIVEYTNNGILQTNDIDKISEFINLYCCDTLIEFEIFSVRGNFFDKMSRPFTKVEVVSIRGEFKQHLGSDNLGIEELFPAMRDLTLLVVLVPNTDCIQREFSNLKRLNVEIWEHKRSRRFTLDNIKMLLKMNPQIRSVRLNTCTRPFLKIVNHILPDLERLEIGNYHNEPYIVDDGQLIEFKNVKNFTTYIGADSVPTNISFPSLLEFYTNAYPRTCNKWIDLVRKSSTLKRLKVWRAFVNNQQLKMLSENDLNLDEVYIEVDKTITDDTIINFIRVNEGAKKITLLQKEKPYSFKSVAKYVREFFENKWLIAESEWKMVLKAV